MGVGSTSASVGFSASSAHLRAHVKDLGPHVALRAVARAARGRAAAALGGRRAGAAPRARVAGRRATLLRGVRARWAPPPKPQARLPVVTLPSHRQ